MKRAAFIGILIVASLGLNACGDSESGTSSAEAESSSTLTEIPGTECENSSSSELQQNSSETSATSEIPEIADTTTRITYTLKPFDGPLANPHKGFTFPVEGLWAFMPEIELGLYENSRNRAWDLITYGSGYQRWSELNPQKGIYNWTKLDALLDALDKHGLGYALRVFPYSQSMGQKNLFTVESDYDWTPSFIYEDDKSAKGSAKHKYNGTEYTLSVPVWDNPTYLQAAKDFATALAAKYDGDPRIEYIDIRSFGEWGEWHASHLNGSEMPSAEIEKDMLDHYASVFKKTLLVLPSSGSGEVYTYALSKGITKRDDGFIGTPGRPDSLVRAYKAGLPTIAENIAAYKAMLNYTDIIPGGYLKWTPERWVSAIKTAHLTYYVLDQDSDYGYKFYTENKALADTMTHVIGYNFHITRAELLTVAKSRETSNVLNITVKNSGVAPCFFDVYMVAEFVNGEGQVLEQLGETIHIPKGSFKDGMIRDFTFASDLPSRQTNVAALPGVSVALSLYESEEAFKSGKNPTVRFDNEGLQENKKLLLKK